MNLHGVARCPWFGGHGECLVTLWFGEAPVTMGGRVFAPTGAAWLTARAPHAPPARPFAAQLCGVALPWAAGSGVASPVPRCLCPSPTASLWTVDPATRRSCRPLTIPLAPLQKPECPFP